MQASSQDGRNLARVLHEPVMVREVLEGLRLSQGDVILDATVGGGGHASHILEKILPGGTLIGIDCDEDAILRSRERLKCCEDSLFLVRANFKEVDTVFDVLDIKSVDGALFDLGVSYDQLESPDRGFGIRVESPLDMRMDARQAITAKKIVNTFREKEIADILYKYGEERLSRRIARLIIETRKKNRIQTTTQLAEIVKRAYGKTMKRQKVHPATRTFQALRIAVNDELNSIREGLEKIIRHLSSGARLCVISFHSLEDRIVKNLFRDLSKEEILRIVTKKPMRPTLEEVRSNPRCRSARLRISERLR